MNYKIHNRGVNLFHLVVFAAVSVIAFNSIASAQIIGKSQQGLSLRKARLWTENNNIVPVCWESYDDEYHREKDIIQAAVFNTWQEFANITFTGWTDCPFGGIAGSGTAKAVRIRISAQGKDKYGRYINAGADGSARVGMDALSNANDNNPGMNLSFAPDGSADKGRLEYIGVHEFGHVLGFIHEQNSPNHNAAHCAGSTEANATALTNYDPDSVMNYCNKDGNMKGALTKKDIQGVIGTYGFSKFKTQHDWMFCERCFNLFYNGFADNKGVCPLGGGHKSAGDNYFLRFDQPERSGDQGGWRSCSKCQSLFFNGFGDNKGKCPAGGAHLARGFNYILAHDIPVTAQHVSSWRSCSKCLTLFYDANPTKKGSCPMGGQHYARGSWDYVLRW